MSGRRPRPGQYVVQEINFWLNDPRIRSISPSAKLFLFFADMIAVLERCHTLPPQWGVPALSLASGLDPRTGSLAYVSLVQKCLLGKSDDGRIIVYGVSSRHENLKWRDDDITKDMSGISPLRGSRSVSRSVRGSRSSSNGAKAPIVSAFPEVFEILQSINSPSFRNLKAYDALEADLKEWSAKWSRDRVVSETKALRTWIEGKFQSGKMKRETKYEPGTRLVNWFRKAETIDEGKDNGSNTNINRRTTEQPHIDTARYDQYTIR